MIRWLTQQLDALAGRWIPILTMDLNSTFCEELDGVVGPYGLGSDEKRTTQMLKPVLESYGLCLANTMTDAGYTFVASRGARKTLDYIALPQGLLPAMR
eukprot:5501309-Pyramimonas_sp.AAC.1